MDFLEKLLVSLFLLSATLLNAQQFEQTYKQLDSLHQIGDYESCLSLEKIILNQIADRQDTLVANTYFYVGNAYLNTYKINGALAYFIREKDLRLKLLPLDTKGYSNSLYNLMYTYAQVSNIKSAIETGEVLLDFDRTTFGVESEEYIFSLNDFIDFLLLSNQWQLAEKNLKNTLSSIPKKSKYNGLMVAKLADVYNYSGQFSKSEKWFQSAIPRVEQDFGRDSQEYQLTLGSYSVLLMSQGKFDRAEELLTSSISAIQQSNWSDKDYLHNNALNNLSLAYQSLGQFASAETSFKAILSSDSLVLGANHPDFAITLSNLGQLYAEEGKHEESEKVLLQALQIMRDAGEESTLSYARKLNNLAFNYQKWNKPLEAIPLLEEALKIFERELGKNSPEYATALFNLGSASISINPSLAYTYLKKAETIRRKVLGRNHPTYAETLEQLSVYQWKKRNKKEVRKLMRAIFSNYYGQVDNFFPVLTEEEKSNLFFSKIKPSLEYYASWVTQEDKNNPEELGELYSATLNTKGLILYATDKVRKRILQSGDTTLINLFETWESQKELLAFYYSQNKSARALDSLTVISKNTEKELSRRSAVFSKEIIRPKYTWQEVQSVLKAGEAAVEIIRFRNYNIDSAKFGKNIHYGVLILTSETLKGPELVLMGNGGLLENRFLNYYRNGIQFKVDNEYSYGNFFELIHSALMRMNVNTLYLSTDGAYNLISAGSIKNPNTQKYLIEELDIRLVTSTRDILSTPRKPSGQSSLLIGFPTYNLSERSLTTSKSVNNPAIVSRSIRGALSRFARGESGIAPLPGTKKEVEQISSVLAKHHQSTILTEVDATEANVKKLESPGILHIATHGYFLEDESVSTTRTPNPLLNSGLILAGATNFIRTGENPLHHDEDGILTAYEAMNLNLDETNIVVLSACETGLGMVMNGEGVYGLQRAFHLAGARYVIMSLWPVDDEATQVLMSNFYKNWSERDDVRSAFMQAQLETKRSYGNPYYWGAFVLIGR